MKRLLATLLGALALLLLTPQRAGAEELDVNSYIFGHIGDAYEWHITTVNGHHISIPLPVIVRSKTTGWHAFSSAHLAHGESWEGFTYNENGKVAEIQPDGTLVRPLDLSFTKNALGLLINGVILILLVLGTARWYRRHDGMKEAPRGLPGVVEMIVMMIEDDVIKPCVGEDYRRYSPYLLTAFFFILINNLMGIFPFFPEVPTWLKVPLPLMPLIEIIGMFTKPFSLMVRLFANMLAGHIMLLGVIAVVFLTAEMGTALNSGLGVLSVVFGVFMDVLELLVSFIQAYVFTMLSSVFIGMSRQHPQHE